MIEALIAISLLLLLTAVGLLIALVRRRSSLDLSPVQARFDAMEKGQERLESALRQELAQNRGESLGSSRQLREEVGASLKGFNDSVIRQMAEVSGLQKNQLDAFAGRLTSLGQGSEQRLEGMRQESAVQARHLREETAACLKAFSDSMVKGMGEMAAAQKHQLETFSNELGKLTGANLETAKQLRTEVAAGLQGFNEAVLKRMTDIAAMQGQQLDAFASRLSALSQSNEQRFDALRQTVEAKLKTLQEDNSKSLEQMRQTVDEKLQGTLEKRLGESFKLVSERLEQVHKGLGEMQTLASGVGDLKRVLTNVKSRGTWGEVQLGALLEEVLTPEQYATNVATRDGGERVEFAIKLPGRGEADNEIVWLPIDAKFPMEDYQRLVEAQERADPVAAEQAGAQLDARLRSCAGDICEKYVNPPRTTDFAILFLPTEGLFAEAVRRVGLTQYMQRECHVTLAGPTTLWSILNSFQMGFRTLAIQQRSSEVWQVLAAVKTEFAKYGDVLTRVQKKLQEATNTIDSASVRTRAIERKLRSVETLPADRAQAALILEAGLAGGNGEADGESDGPAIALPGAANADRQG